VQLLAVAPLITAIALVVSAIFVAIQLRNVRRDRFIAVTNELFGIWQTTDFMAAQLWLIHDVAERSWGEFQSRHGKDGEAAFLRVTGFYNRVGTLITLGIVDERTILRTIGATAYAVWTKTEPLTKGARAENVTLLWEFERLMPICRSVLQLGVAR
jgi:hypothetical protein